MMTALVEDGEKQCERYWPDEGSSLYNIYEVRNVIHFQSAFISVVAFDLFGSISIFLLYHVGESRV